MDVTESGNDCSNDLILLDRVFLRLGNADTDEQLENCLNKFLTAVLLKLSSPYEQVRTKVMELLVHVNKRVKCRSEVQLPVSTLLHLYKAPKGNNFVINFSIIYLTLGFPRLPKEEQMRLAPYLLDAIEDKPANHQDQILILLIPLLGEINVETLYLKERTKLAQLLLKFATDILLLPYRALPTSSNDGTEFQVPPGMSLRGYKRIVGKNVITADQLEQMKLSVVNFLSKDVLPDKDILLPLIVAAADSRFSVANQANSPLARVSSGVEWSSPGSCSALYALYLGTWAGLKVAADDRRVPACTRLRLKLLPYLIRASGAAIAFPQCVQVFFTSIFDENSNSRLKTLALNFLLNVVNNGEEKQLKLVAEVILQGLLKIVRSEDYAEHHAKAYTCIGRLAIRVPACVNTRFNILEEFVKKVVDAAPELKTSMRDALLDMANAYKVAPKDKGEAMETSDGEGGSAPASGSNSDDKMDVDPAPGANYTEPKALALFALLDHYMHSEEPMIRYVATRYAAVVFPPDHVPAKYLLLLASGDSQDEISNEALKCLYGTFRSTEIENVVNNVEKHEPTPVNIDEDAKPKQRSEDNAIGRPSFRDMVNFVWEQIDKRKKGSNSKHRFVVNNQVLPFHPLTFQEILRYLRMCLNYDAELKDCSNHPNNASPKLAAYIGEHLLHSEVLERYLNMITSLLNANPDVMPLTCFLDIVGCVPQKMSQKYTNLLPFLKNLFSTSTKEDIRHTSAVIYSIISTQTSEKSSIDREISSFVDAAVKDKSLEAQCGYATAFSNMCERCLVLNKKGKFGGKGFSSADWEPFKVGASCLAQFMTSNQNLLINSACTNIALLSRCTGLPFPNSRPDQEATINSEKPFAKTDAPKEDTGPVTKFTIVERLFATVNNAKVTSKIKEKALYALGVMCCGERFPFAKQIVKGFLEMAKDSKEFEIHLEIGESLVLCIEGTNSNEGRDMWTELPLQMGHGPGEAMNTSAENHWYMGHCRRCYVGLSNLFTIPLKDPDSKQGMAKVKDRAALEENDVLFEWLLQELFILAKVPHPHSRQATSIWLLALLKNCPEREPIKSKLQLLQDIFMDFLSENNEVVQDVASKGLSLVYQASEPARRQALVSQIVEQLASGRRAVAQVTDDTRLFEEGQLGTAPQGGNLSTYKELCSLASDLNQPDLLYKFMHLAHHNSVWNSKKGAAFGFHGIAVSAGAQLAQHLPRIVPRLYRYRCDPTPRIQHSMQAIWQALVPDTHKTVQKYHKEILADLVENLTNNQWRVRISCCNALADLLRGAASLHDSLEQLPRIWTQLFRVMDDVHEGTRLAAASTAHVLSKLCIRAADVNSGKDGKVIVSAILPVLLEKGITDLVREVRNVSLVTVSKLVTAAGESLKPFLPLLIPALVTAAGELESTKLSYLSTALGSDADTREALDDMRAAAAKHHYTTDTVVKCMQYVDAGVLEATAPRLLELCRSPQLGTKVACCHFFVLAAHQLRAELAPLAGRLMPALLSGALDRNATVRKTYADALGQIAIYAKESTVEKLMKRLIEWYNTKDDDISRSVVAHTLKSISRSKPELLRDHAATLAPMVFLAMHAPKDEEEATVEIFEDVWTDISPGKETGIRQHRAAICQQLEEALNSRSWTKKVQAASAIKTITKESSSGLGGQREQLLRMLLAAAHGKTFDGKYHILEAIAELCQVREGESEIASGLADDCADTLVAECRKSEPVYRRRALLALGAALPALRRQRFPQLHAILEAILLKDETSIGKESDEEDNEGARNRRDQLIALKDAAYEVMGRAWPEDKDTQSKYAGMFFAHCAQAYASRPRSSQLAMLVAIALILDKLQMLKARGGETEARGAAEGEALASLVAHVCTVVDYTLKTSNQTRHRREALHIISILGKHLKELDAPRELAKVRDVYQQYSSDLSNDPSHELRAKLDEIKLILK